MTHLYVLLHNLAARTAEAAQRVRREEGATAVEYALMISMIVLAIIGAVAIFSRRVASMYNTYANTIPS